MVTDGIKDRQGSEKMASLDIAEIVLKSMGLEETKAPVDVYDKQPFSISKLTI